MTNNFYDLSIVDNESTSALSLTILRDALIPELVGDTPNILYWTGKRLARKFPLAKDEDLPRFFHQVNWGTLQRTKGKTSQQIFTLSGKIVSTRLQINPQADFKLECGFLAETIQSQSGFMTEALVDNINAKKGLVTIIAQLDTKDPLDFELYEQPEPLTLKDFTESETKED